NVPPGQSKTDGISVGAAVASAVLGLRANDGAYINVPYTSGSAIGQWQPTAPAYESALYPQWGQLTPFAMNSGNQFRPTGPPPVGSAQYQADYDQVKLLGDSKRQPADPNDPNDPVTVQHAIARFWADGAGSYTPAGHWNQIATAIAQDQNFTLFQ